MSASNKYKGDPTSRGHMNDFGNCASDLADYLLRFFT